MANIFRAYDIRGLYPIELNTDVARKAAAATVQYLKAKTILVGEDGRISSPELRQAIFDGITKAGSDVIYIGQCTTPMFYFATKHLKVDGGIMITASHNPPEYNGLKITRGPMPISQNSGLGEIKSWYENLSGELSGSGAVKENKDILKDYVDFLIKTSGLKPGDIKSKIAVDAGHGVAALVMERLFDELEINYEPLHFKIDGAFPVRPPDPAKEGALNPLRDAVLSKNLNCGLAFDGDADRLVVMDEKGDVVPAQFVLILLWESLNKPKTVYDLRFSKTVKDILGSRGIQSRVGHSFVSDNMAKESASLGGETSGHFFFKEMEYTESSELASLLLLKLMSSGDTLSEMVKPLKQYAYSGEINLAISNEPLVTSKIFENLKAKYKDGKIEELDGITIDLWDREGFWFNIRPSNTEPMLRFVVEAQTKELLNQKVSELESIVKSS